MQPTLRPPRSGERGMTIIEVLMVVFIIGLAAGIVVLTIPQRPTQEQAAAQAFAKLVRDAQDQAILTGQPVGLDVSNTSFRLVQWRRNQWLPYTRPQLLPNRLEIEQRTEQPDQPEGWPELVFDPTGIVQPAEFRLRGRGERIDIVLNERGEVDLVAR